MVVWIIVASGLLSVALPLVVVSRALRAEAKFRAERRRVLDTGLTAQARVVRVGASPRGKLFVTASLEVQPSEGGPSFSASTVTYVPSHAASAVAPGKALTVRYDARDRQRVEIDLSTMGYDVPR